ncbi:hypothetical protein [Kocuria tytonicola]|uniref:hypothetical protein n=1 Tax=Kocuria tytonicola TaxID=2055946 RepID=UPI000F519DBA|nr:hypothetical protein [Kocuria tytonicola]
MIAPFKVSELEGTGYLYSVNEVPSWWLGPSKSTPQGKEHKKKPHSKNLHMLLLAKYKSYIAVYASHGSDWNRILTAIENNELKGLTPIAPELLNGAFTDPNWPMLAVWMKGIHPPVEQKANSKQLTGLNIRSALDPFGDQTYAFSSGRSKLNKDGEDATLGLSPSKHKIWLGHPSCFDDFCSDTLWCLKALEGAKRRDSPIAELARPLSKVTSIGTPTEVALHLEGEMSQWNDEIKDAVSALDRVNLNVDSPHGVVINSASPRKDKVQVSAIRDGCVASTVCLELSYSDATGRVNASLKPVSGDSKISDSLRILIENEDWAIIRYDDGHVVANGRAYMPSYNLKPFTSWNWVDFGKTLGSTQTGTDITREKPTQKGEKGNLVTDLSRTGELGDDSLFSWVHFHWGWERAGHLLCDDGAGEIADFVHLADEDPDGVSLLTLIHIKSSSSSSPGRKISVTQYEEVAGQAVKNLKHASPKSIIDKLKTLSSGALHWVSGTINGAPTLSARKGGKAFADELKRRGDKVRLRVVIVQPRLEKKEYQATLQQSSASITNRVHQLGTLLLETEAACRSVGAEFLVFTSEK